MLDYSEQYEVKIWAYCLMTNHVHFVMVPRDEVGLSLTMKAVQQAYSTYFNHRQGQTGHLWQCRFFSCVLDEPHLYRCIRYVERNPVRASMVERAEQYFWSSASAHCGMSTDLLLTDDIPFVVDVEDWGAWLAEDEEEESIAVLRRHTVDGHVCGSESFTDELGRALNRNLHHRPRGRPKRESP
jgi:putative transposase